MAASKPQSTYNEIIAGLADSHADFKPFHNFVLVGIYMRPEKTAGGLYLTDKSRQEDQYQGKAAFVISKGPMAFKDDPETRTFFYGQNVEPGDLILYRISEGFPFDLNGIHCRLMQDTEIKGRLIDPTTIY